VKLSDAFDARAPPSFQQEDFMAERIASISAKQLSAEVQTAVKKALSNNAALKGTPVQPKFVMSPWLVGFILRELELKDKTFADAQGLATDVANLLPSAKGKTPATLIHDNLIIMGFIQDKLLELGE
jgi:hypothetical protein